MLATNRATRLRFGIVMVAAVLTCGCSHFSGMRWPLRHKAEPPPAAVNELLETDASGNPANYPQYWKRNTLLIDLAGVTGEGELMLRPRPTAPWPVRLALRVMPGAIGVLEVRAEQRVILPVAQEGRQAVDLELVPGVYSATSAQITVRWSAR